MMHMPHASPLSLAKQSLEMSKQSDSKVFQTVAMVTMGVMALAAVMQAGHVLWHDLEKRHPRGHDHGRGR